MCASNVLPEGKMKSAVKVMLLAIIAAGSIFVYPALGQTSTPPAPTVPATKSAPAAAPATGAKSPVPSTPSTYRPSVPRREVEYYDLMWGVDSFSVKAVESGELIRFSWHVLDANKAKLLNDEKFEPFLIDPAARVKLVVPELPFMGKMRVKNTPEAGMIYWMGFSNPGKVVKPGDRVNVVIGQFHADGLVVQ
jgi:hypothetical protein